MTPDALKAARESAGMTALQLAEAIGVTRRSIYRYEAGERPISALVEKAIQNALREQAANGKDGVKTGRARGPVAARKSSRNK